MKKHKLRKVIDLKLLEKLIKDEDSCVHLHQMKEHLALHPYHLNELNNSVKDVLNDKIGKFCARFDGILCGYKNINFLSELGQISDDSCFIHVDIEADFFIFKPLVEKMLKGVVNKISNDHVGCLVHGIFNVSLPRPKHLDNWIGQSLTLNSEIQLRINYTNFEGKLPYIRGEIVSVVEELVSENQKVGLGDNTEHQNSQPQKNKHRKNAKKLLFNNSSDSVMLGDSRKNEMVEQINHISKFPDDDEVLSHNFEEINSDLYDSTINEELDVLNDTLSRHSDNKKKSKRKKSEDSQDEPCRKKKN